MTDAGMAALRERLIAFVASGSFWRLPSADEAVDAILAEIAKTHELVERERLERFIYAAEHPRPPRGTTAPAVVLFDNDLVRPEREP